MFLSMAHGSPLLGNLTNSKMDRYLHCVGSLENQTCGIEQQKLTTHQIPRKKSAASVRVCVFGRKGQRASPAKGLELFKLRSEVYLLAHDTNKTNVRDVLVLVGTMVRAEVFIL
jgi:hypothetical protein